MFVIPSLASIDQDVSDEYLSSCKTRVIEIPSIDGGLEEVGPIVAIMLDKTEGFDVIVGDIDGAGPTRKIYLIDYWSALTVANI
jgi:hypothetical protein